VQTHSPLLELEERQKEGRDVDLHPVLPVPRVCVPGNREVHLEVGAGTELTLVGVLLLLDVDVAHLRVSRSGQVRVKRVQQDRLQKPLFVSDAIEVVGQVLCRNL